MGIRDYKELKVWQKSMELVKTTYQSFQFQEAPVQNLKLKFSLQKI